MAAEPLVYKYTSHNGCTFPSAACFSLQLQIGATTLALDDLSDTIRVICASL